MTSFRSAIVADTISTLRNDCFSMTRARLQLVARRELGLHPRIGGLGGPWPACFLDLETGFPWLPEEGNDWQTLVLTRGFSPNRPCLVSKTLPFPCLIPVSGAKLGERYVRSGLPAQPSPRETRSPTGRSGQNFPLFSRVVALGLFTRGRHETRNPLSGGPFSPNLCTSRYFGAQKKTIDYGFGSSA